MIKRLYNRRVKEVLLFVTGGVTGLEDQIKKYFPQADLQLCVVHKVRNLLARVRYADKKGVAESLKRIYKSKDKEEALKYFGEFKEKWRGRYPLAYRVVRERPGSTSCFSWIIRKVCGL